MNKILTIQRASQLTQKQSSLHVLHLLKKIRKHAHSNILPDKRNATVKFCHVLRMAHKHELPKLTMTRSLSQVSG